MEKSVADRDSYHVRGTRCPDLLCKQHTATIVVVKTV